MIFCLIFNYVFAHVYGSLIVLLHVIVFKNSDLHMTCIWRPPLYGGHFCQVPRVAAIDRFDCIYIYIYIYIYIFAKFAVAFSSAIAKSIVKRITDGLLMLSQNCSSTNMHFHFKHKSDIQMIFLYFNFVFNNNNNNNRVNIELLTYMENVNCSGTHFSFEKKEEKKDKFMTALCF